MAVPAIKGSFAAGEITPGLYGHVDLAKFAVGAATQRNLFTSYRGGAYSRAGMAFIGYSKQCGRNVPPRLITFQFSINQGRALEFGNNYMRVIANGAYVTEATKNITGVTNATPAVVTSAAHGFVNGDWVFLTGILGMSALNGRTFIVGLATVNTFALFDVFGNQIATNALPVYAGGGTAARVYTLVTPWAEADLEYLKFTQSADTMSMCCWNQVSGTIYQPQDLKRLADNNWTLTALAPGPSVVPPTAAAATPSAAATTDYQYVVTSINPVDGTESIASNVADSPNSVNIGSTLGAIYITWTPAVGVAQYNVYKATPVFGGTVPAGAIFGFAGTAFGAGFTDNNITPDFTQVPPTATNPFVAGGNTYPSVVAYFQQRRVYSGSPNNPDTYWMSQPGAFTNFDVRTPTVSSDAITGTPWSVQVNGIQAMVPMPGGLVVLTGLSAWQLSGSGGSSVNPQAITPSNQQAQPQAYNGCSSTVQPIKINFDIIYVQAKGSIVRDLAYNFFVNIYTGQDVTILSSHLFSGYTIREWAWCEEPYKIIWAVRNDGVMLSLTYLKEQEVNAWARHDTQGLFQSCCAVTEPPVDALYVAVQRFTPQAAAANQNCYMIERMNNRVWQTIEDAWCVDAGLQLAQPAPNATLTPDSAFGLGALTGVVNLVGGANYSAGTTATVVDQNGGPGTGAVPTLTIVAGVITAIQFLAGQQGTKYRNPMLVFNDPTQAGSGASANPVLSNTVTLRASAGVFSAASIGQVVRGGGGAVAITTVISNQVATGLVRTPFTQVVPNSGGIPAPLAAGAWTMTQPVQRIGGLNHLIGMPVTGLADGQIIPPTTVANDGSINLAVAASAVVVGLGFTAQLQSVYLNEGQPTMQGQRKVIKAVTVRIETSRDFTVGTNQTDGSTLSPPAIEVLWPGMTAAPNVGGMPYLPPVPYPYLAAGAAVPPTPLYTGDVRTMVGAGQGGGYQKPGQIAVQQSSPVPLQVLAFIPELLPGDLPEVKAADKRERQQQQKMAA